MAKRREYERAGIVSIAEVLPLIRDPKIKSVVLHGHTVNVTSLRLQNFAKSCVCSSCQLEATHFAVEDNSGYSWHLNLWADRGPEKREMLFTHDHTLARSLGGSDDEANTTTMCAKCNHAKGKEERVEFCRRNNLPLPGSGAERKKENKRKHTEMVRSKVRSVHATPMEHAVLKFYKLQRKAAEAVA